MKLTKEKLWKKAKRVILGGNLLLSKRPEMFLPEYWPTYFKKAKGINVWDLKNRKYIDMIFAVYQCAIFSTILVQSHEEAVKRIVRCLKRTRNKSMQYFSTLINTLKIGVMQILLEVGN